MQGPSTKRQHYKQFSNTRSKSSPGIYRTTIRYPKQRKHILQGKTLTAKLRRKQHQKEIIQNKKKRKNR